SDSEPRDTVPDFSKRTGNDNIEAIGIADGAGDCRWSLAVALGPAEAREIPQAGPALARRPVSQQVAPDSVHRDRNFGHRSRSCPPGVERKHVLPAAVVRFAVLPNRAGAALGALRRADRCPELHQGLIDETRSFALHHPAREFPKQFPAGGRTRIA